MLRKPCWLLPPDGLKLLERAPVVSVEEIVCKTAGKLIVEGEVPEMQVA